jgi:tetratricopeptide (TPR) repeat protein
MVVMMAASTATADHGSDAHRAKALYQNGLKHYNVGEYREALQSFKDAYLLKADPVLLFNMGQAYRQLGDDEGSAREYRAYLREQPDAPNHAEVEKFIAAAEEQLRHKAANAPPTGVIAPNVKESDEAAAPATASPPATATPATSEAVSVEKPARPRRRWLWPVVGTGLAVVVGGAVALGLAFGLPRNAPVRSGTDPTLNPTFH